MKAGALLARLRRPAPAHDPAPEPEPESAREAKASLVLTWEGAVELIRSRRGDVFEIQFVAREYERLREGDDPTAAARADSARAHLESVIERKLRAKGLLAPEGRVELVDA